MTGAIRGTCHCGGVEFTVRLSDGLSTARRCDCSMCARRGAVAVSAPLEGIEIVQGADLLTLYQFGTREAEHYFCSVCGIYTHHKRRSDPTQIGVNLACLEGHSPFLHEVVVTDGVHHPNDTGVSRVVGRLRFEKEESADERG